MRLGSLSTTGTAVAITRLGAALVLCFCLCAVGCGDDGKPDGGGFTLPDGGSTNQNPRLDGRVVDLGAAPDGLPQSAEGPRIEVIQPRQDETVVGGVLRLQARIIDTDGIDAQTVEVTLQSRNPEPVPMGLTATPDVFEALLDISDLAGAARVWIVAADLRGNTNSKILEFTRDPGPIINFVSPKDQERQRSSVSLQVVVADATALSSFEVRIGSHVIQMQETVTTEQQRVFVGSIDFDDPVFGLPLSGRQVLTATAVNANGAKTIEQRTFVVDDKGPSIVVKSQAPGDLIGGIVDIEVELTDQAGVLASSAQVLIGNELDNRLVTLRPDLENNKNFIGQFDTRTLSDHMLWPVMSFRVADSLGNESHYDLQVALDNGPPRISLDPPANFHAWREREGVIECSRPFDPVGDDAVNDLQTVQQIAEFRARIEDQGNYVPSAEWLPVAAVDPSSVWLYVLHSNLNRPLIVDGDGDGECDAINPEVIPLGSEPRPDQAVAVNLVSIPPGGVADFRPFAAPPVVSDPFLPPGCTSEGIAVRPPGTICDVTPLTVLIYYLSNQTPAIWTIPNVVTGDALRCLGLPFDFRANEVEDGWVCVAVSARDNLGNLGVSWPLRVWVDKDNVGKPGNAGPPPDCPGTLIKSSGQITNQACRFREAEPGVQWPHKYRQHQIRKL